MSAIFPILLSILLLYIDFVRKPDNDEYDCVYNGNIYRIDRSGALKFSLTQPLKQKQNLPGAWKTHVLDFGAQVGASRRAFFHGWLAVAASQPVLVADLGKEFS